MITVRSTIPVNLLTKSHGSGIIHVPAKLAVQVPDDVLDEPGFEMLKKDGFIIIVEDSKVEPELESTDDEDKSEGELEESEEDETEDDEEETK